MNPQQMRYYQESMNLCQKLLCQIDRNMDESQRMFSGDLLKEYRKAIEMTQKKVKQIRGALQNAQSGQQ